MPYDEDQIANLEADVDDLVTPTTEDVLAFSQDYDAGIVAASALQKSLNGGGGGGSFNGGTITEPLIIENSLAVTGGIFTQLAPEGNNGVFFDVGSWDGNNELTIAQSLAGAGRLEYWDGGDVVFEIGPGGAVTISPSDANATALRIDGPADGMLIEGRLATEQFFTVSSLGEVLIAVQDASAIPLDVRGWTDQEANLAVFSILGNDPVFTVGPTGAVTISPSGDVDGLTVNGVDGGSGKLAYIQGNTWGEGLTVYPQFEAGSHATVQIQASDPAESQGILELRDGNEVPVLTVGPTGAVTISPSADVQVDIRAEVTIEPNPAVPAVFSGLTIQTWTEEGVGASAAEFGLSYDSGYTHSLRGIFATDEILRVVGVDSSVVQTIGPTGAVTISPSATLNLALKVGDGADANRLGVGADIGPDADQGGAWVSGTLGASLGSGDVFQIMGTGTLLRLTHDQEIGFFGVTPVAQQSVAIGINEIHAALVNLGLIVEAP